MLVGEGVGGRVAGEICWLYGLQLWNSHSKEEMERALFAKLGWTVELEFWEQAQRSGVLGLASRMTQGAVPLPVPLTAQLMGKVKAMKYFESSISGSSKSAIDLKEVNRYSFLCKCLCFYFLKFNWCIVDLQCCDNFSCTANDSVIHGHISILFIFFSHMDYHSILGCSLCYTAGPHWPVIPYTSVRLCQSQTPTLSLPSTWPLC